MPKKYDLTNERDRKLDQLDKTGTLIWRVQEKLKECKEISGPKLDSCLFQFTDHVLDMIVIELMGEYDRIKG